MTDLSPNYSQAEDICNSVTHIAGAVLTVYGTYLLILTTFKTDYCRFKAFV